MKTTMSSKKTLDSTQVVGETFSVVALLDGSSRTIIAETKIPKSHVASAIRNFIEGHTFVTTTDLASGTVTYYPPSRVARWEIRREDKA